MSIHPRESGVSEVSGAQTLLRALDILEALASEVGPLALGEISVRCNLTPPTAYRLVKALASRGFVITDAQRRYSLGPAVVRLSSIAMRRSDDLVALLSPTLEEIRNLTGETVSLHCRLGNERVCVTELVAQEPIRMESGIGRSYPIYAGAAGKALLAWLPEVFETIRDNLIQIGPATITDPRDLEAELERIRKRGYAVSESEVVPNAAAFAIPVFDSLGSVVASVNVAGPSNRWTRTKITRLRPVLLDVVSNASKLLSPT
jgi:DNA-binding IclR family transcriptional regulator